MKKIIFSLVAVLGLIGFVAQAEEAPAEFLKTPEEQKTVPAVNKEIPAELQKLADQTNAQAENKNQVEIIADVSIRNVEASEVKKNHLKIVFDLENSMETQAGLIYGLELIKRYPDEKEALMDVKLFPKDLLTVEKGGTLHREINYLAPDYLSGNFVLWLKIKNESGLVLALQPFQVNFAGTGRYLEQSNPCYLSIEGENEQKYNLRQGVDLKKEEKLFLNCQIKNLTGEDILVTPNFEFYRRDLYGLKITNNVVEAGMEMAFANSEDRLVQLAIPLPVDPQAYDVKVVFQKEEKILSNPVVAHFVLAGKSASISQLTLDKDKYQAGETAKLGILWSGSADTFRDSRTGGSGLVNPLFEIEIKNQDGKTFCLPKQTKKPGEFEKTMEIKLDQDCVYPIATVRILDEGQLLYKKTINLLPEREIGNKKSSEKATLPQEFNKLFLLIAGSILVVVGFLVIMIKGRRGQKISIVLFAFAFGTFLFGGGDEAQARTAILRGTPFMQGTASSWLTDTNWVLPFNCGEGGHPVCADRIVDRTYPCRDRNEPKKIHFSLLSAKGCYQDIVNFNYDLTTTSVNQGDSITATGSAEGLNICSNGIDADISVVPKSGASSQAILDEWFNDSKVHTGSTSFSTSGWTCGNYSAVFDYSFIHSGTHSGSGSIPYSVNNCCNPTCATGPGCKASLANGSITSGVCCSGSCYTCNTGYSWNGSMCTEDSCGGSIVSNAAAYDAEESSVPVPAGTNWTYSASDNATKCQYSCNSGYNWNGSACVLPTTYSCTGTIPANAAMFSGDNLGLTANTPYTYWATDTGTKCQYSCNSGYNWNGSACVPVVVCSGWSLSLDGSPSSGSAPLSSNLTATINAVFGGENYTYSNHSCGSGGPAPTNVSGRNFTCNYSSSGTYYPSVTARAQSTGCTLSASSTVSVSAAPLPTNNSSCVSMTGVPASIVAGETFTAQVTVQNTGTKTWNSDGDPHRLGSWNPNDNLIWGLNRVGLPVASVAPGAQTTFSFSATAPATPATYSFDWRMVEDFKEWFGPTCSTNVIVTPACTPFCNTSENTCATLGCGEHYKYNCTPTCAPSDCAGNPKCTEKLQCPCNSGNWQETGE